MSLRRFIAEAGHGNLHDDERSRAALAAHLKRLGARRESIPVASVSVASLGSRHKMYDARVREYHDKIKRGESVQPIVATDRGDGSYGLVNGRHRLEAHRLAGKTHVDAHVYSPKRRDE